MSPASPFVVAIEGNSTSVEHDTVRVTVYSGGTARGTVTTTLDSNKRATLDLANSSISPQDGDKVVVTENGSALGGVGETVKGGAVPLLKIAPTAVAFPSRSL